MFEFFLDFVLVIVSSILIILILSPIAFLIYILRPRNKKTKNIAKTNSIQGGLCFPNAITKEEYYERKATRENDALSDTSFWDKLEVDIFDKNLEYFKRGICPYCAEKLPERKGKTYKCPSCKGKVYRKREILTTNEGLFTADEREILNNLWDEFQSRKSFLELWEQANNIMTITLDENKKYDMKSAAQQAMMLLRLGKPEFYKKKDLRDLRNCRMVEGEFQRRFGTKQQATNVYMSILYMDLVDDFMDCYTSACLDDFDLDIDDNGNFIVPTHKKETITKKALKKFNKEKPCIAPAIYGWAFGEDLPLEEFEKIFKFNANSLNETFKGKLPISPDEAWVKIEKHTKEQTKQKPTPN